MRKHQLGGNMKYLLTIGTMLLVFSCTTNPRSGSTEHTTSNLPAWFSNLEVDNDIFFGHGMAKKQNPSLGLKTASARARDDIAQQISVKVENLIKDFMQESGIGDNAKSLEFTSSVSKQVVSKVIEGSSPDKQEKANDGTWYVRIRYSKAEARQALEEALDREQALFDEFKAQQSFDELKAEAQNLN